jgi:hypothetical protein
MRYVALLLSFSLSANPTQAHWTSFATDGGLQFGWRRFEPVYMKKGKMGWNERF